MARANALIMSAKNRIQSFDVGDFHIARFRYASFVRIPRTYEAQSLWQRLQRTATWDTTRLRKGIDTHDSIIRPLTDHGQVINVSCFNSPVARFRHQKIELISSAVRTQSSRRHSDRRCLCTSLPADTGTEAASSSRAFGPGLRTSTQ